MIDRKALKAKSKEYAFSHKMVVWKPFLYMMAIAFVGGIVLSFVKNKAVYGVLELLLSLAILPISFASFQYVMKKMHGEEADVVDLFEKKYKIYVPILILSILVSVICGIGFMLLIVPGIILALRYSMSAFMAAEAEEEFDVIETMKKSATMMDGHKWEYFVFQLSFIGWYLLGIITLGIAYIWILPYVTVAEINYYEELKKLQK